MATELPHPHSSKTALRQVGRSKRLVDHISRGVAIMNKLSIALSIFLAPPALSVAADPRDARHFGHGNKIVTFQTMYGVDGPFLGEANAIRGVIGDELPWVVNGLVRGELDTRGNLRIMVHGLV